MSRRLVAIVAALALAAVATVALVSYLRDIEREALAAVETVDVFVARDGIPGGMTVESAQAQGLLVRDAAPRSLVPRSAVNSLDEIEGRVAATDLVAGEVLVRERFVLPTDARAMLPIPDDMQAMSLEVSIPPGVAGFIQNGDTISILAHLAAPAADEQEDAAEGDVRVQYLLHNVPVLNVGQRVVVTEEEGERDVVRRDENRVLLTVALDPVDAEKLAFALFNGDLWLTLVPEDQPAPSTPGRTFENAFD
jgi:pilus assembly protein CpaB